MEESKKRNRENQHQPSTSKPSKCHGIKGLVILLEIGVDGNLGESDHKGGEVVKDSPKSNKKDGNVTMTQSQLKPSNLAR